MAVEAGIRPQRIEYIQETTKGTTPSNPAWQGYSDTVKSWWDWEPDANVQEDRGHGDPDPVDHFTGSETHDATIAYRLKQWFVDGSGNAQDAIADAMLVSSDNDFNNTHSVVSREDHSTGGNDSAGVRIYHVGKGGCPVNAVVPFETEDGSPIQVELSYQFEKMRTYKIHQPSSGTTLQITNNGSTSVDVTVEDEGASTTETNTVASGGTTVTTTASFSDIDAIELDSDTDGDVVVTDGSGTTLATIRGSQNYNHGEGDLGVPALGTGSHATEPSTGVHFIDDSIPTWSGNDIAAEFISGELEVDLEVDDNSQLGTGRRNIEMAGRTTTVSGTIAGDSESVEQIFRFLAGQANDFVWTADEGSVTISNAQYTSPGTSGFEPNQGKHRRDITLEGQGITIA